jgi:hypothetical protein
MAVGATSGGGGGSKSGDVRAGGAFVEVSAKDSLSTALARINTRVQKFASGMKAAGSKIALFGAAGLAPLTALFASGVNRAEGLGRTAQQLGFTTDQLQRLQYAADVAGVSLEDVMKMPGRYSGLMDSASILDPQTIKDATAANQEFRKTWIELQNAITPLVSAIAPVVKTIGQFIRDNSSLVGVAVAAAGAVAALGAALWVAGAAIGGAVTVGGVLVSIVSALLTPAAAVAGVVAALGVAFFGFTSTGQDMGKKVSGAFSEILATGKQTVGGIASALADGDISKAWSIALAGLSVLWKTFTLGITKAWVAVKNTVVDVWKDAIAEITKLWNNAVEFFGGPAAAGLNAQIDAERAAQKAGDREFRNKQVDDARAELNKARSELDALVKPSEKADKPKRPEDYLYLAGVAQRGAFRITGDQRQFGEGKNSEMVKLQGRQVGLLEGILGENKALNRNLRIT